MCTVSFYKNKKQVILTSNRDEHHSRMSAAAPEVYAGEENYQLLYCKDAKAGGTWMAMRCDGTAIVLLNGAFERHAPDYPYRKSRGLVLLDIINKKDCLHKFKTYDLTNIEPFTIVLYHYSSLYECIWNGSEKFITEKSSDEKHIWSSVTLYDTEFRKMKKNLFQQLIASKTELSKDDILDFHHSKQDLENGFIINRNEQLLTFSITQIFMQANEYSFYHHDIRNDKEYTQIIYADLEKSLL
jgi:uncharacterized protein with NRDE domain